ncbi:NeuB family protein [[Clostridium] aminophilum]|uniref:NeuB family protein n=1 Tax=[Clostridium] aminophilum TaxID=1526 RepID=A0A1I0EEL3_9FIRM|nr:NeuB family protein [[Clostridium] aminophilum]
MYGSDQAASIEPNELMEMVQNIRLIETMLGSGEKILSESELITKKKLRG